MEACQHTFNVTDYDLVDKNGSKEHDLCNKQNRNKTFIEIFSF